MQIVSPCRGVTAKVGGHDFFFFFQKLHTCFFITLILSIQLFVCLFVLSTLCVFGSLLFCSYSFALFKESLPVNTLSILYLSSLPYKPIK